SVPEGTTLTLRIYGMDLVSAGTAFRNKNVVISGTTASSCEPQTANAGGKLSVCKGQATPALAGSVGGSATAGVWSSDAGGKFTPSASDLNATWTPPSEFTGTATLTLTTTNGCSTQATSNKTITVNNMVQVNNPQTICQGGGYSINGNTYTSAGTYTDVLQTQNGCDSTVVTTLTIEEPELNIDVATSQDGTTFTALENNANYQWVRCDENYAPIGGVTTQSFTPQQTGSYAVRLTSLQCPSIVDSSKCISINKDNVGIVGNLHVAGNSEFTGDVTIRNGLKLKGLEADSIDINDSTELSLLFLRGVDGVLKTGGISNLLDFIYTPLPFQCFEGYSPIWSNKPGVLYTGLAPCNGNVGIGTDNPAARLHVMGSAIATGNLQIGRGASNGAMITGYRQGVTNAGLLNLGQYNPQTQTEFTALNLRSDGELTLNRQDNGNFFKLINIGLNEPVLTVDANGELAINRQNSGNFIHLRNTDLDISVFTIDANGNLRVRNASRDVFHINTSNQTVFARKIVVDEAFWPDYVFEKNYRLRPLGEVKQFIEQNGHLPNVPSQKEVEENGVDLGKMVNVLLEKVEELTLYAIQQQEEIECLKQLLEQQETNK
ncbi:MAG TPA: hypothetical protein VFD91_17600, partial [Mariniphaga sp.]|nr:hypothetical protein [Mariniphaga sp.]